MCVDFLPTPLYRTLSLTFQASPALITVRPASQPSFCPFLALSFFNSNTAGINELHVRQEHA